MMKILPLLMGVWLPFLALTFEKDKISIEPEEPELIFVYNAKSGIVNGVVDYVHKIVSPETYQCNLCALTYDNLGKKSEWVKFLETLKMKISFTYRDEIRDDPISAETVALPAVFMKKKGHAKLLISSAEINKLSTLDELVVLVKRKVGAMKCV